MKLSSTIRDTTDKIVDIKHIRSLTKLLGRFNIPSCFQVYIVPHPTYNDVGVFIGNVQYKEVFYGMSLTDCKKYVESKYTYKDKYADGYNSLMHTNIINDTKCIRRFMYVLNALGIRSGDGSLYFGKRAAELLRKRI